MVGLGTGMAPFRSFIQQRVMQKAAGEEVGEMLLYFGARYEATEFLYGDEIRAYHDDGILNHLKTAFSRDQEEKIYAQHRIAEDPELLYDYMVNKDAAIYLCGPAGNMPKQMKDAVVDAIAKVGGMPREQAVATVTDWQIKGKYNVEVVSLLGRRVPRRRTGMWGGEGTGRGGGERRPPRRRGTVQVAVCAGVITRRQCHVSNR